MRKTITTDAGPDGVDLDIAAAALELDVDFRPGVEQARIELSGPQEAVDGATAERHGPTWRIRIPDTAPAITASGPGVVITGTTAGSIIFSGNVTRINGASGTTVLTGSADPVRARVVLPQGGDLVTDITSGSVTATGRAGAVDHGGHNASLAVHAADSVAATCHNGSITVGAATGRIDVRTHNGPVRIEATGAETHAATHNGALRITAGSDGPIRATSHNGPITVHTGRHNPKVRTRTHNGPEHID